MRESIKIRDETVGGKFTKQEVRIIDGDKCRLNDYQSIGSIKK